MINEPTALVTSGKPETTVTNLCDVYGKKIIQICCFVQIRDIFSQFLGFYVITLKSFEIY